MRTRKDKLIGSLTSGNPSSREGDRAARLALALARGLGGGRCREGDAERAHGLGAAAVVADVHLVPREAVAEVRRIQEGVLHARASTSGMATSLQSTLESLQADAEACVQRSAAGMWIGSGCPSPVNLVSSESFRIVEKAFTSVTPVCTHADVLECCCMQHLFTSVALS